MNGTVNFRILHILNHILGIYGLISVILTGQYYWLLIFLVVFLWTGIVGVNVSLHRYFSHKSFTTSPLKERILLYSSIVTCLGSPAMWCSIHRAHHSFSDTVRDPHNPRLIGKFKTWFTLWPHKNIQKRFIVPFLQTNEMKIIHKYYFLINYVILLILLLINVNLGIFIFCLPAVFCFHGASAIGVIPHYYGYITYKVNDSSRNNIFASIMSLGEGWHNNHHANPGRWYQGEKWWEFDPPAFMIKYVFASK
jgi:fatty-acid desaturase